MKRARLPYLTQKTTKGQTYWYFRRGGAYVRLPDPKDPTFLPAYNALLQGKPLLPSTTARTWRGLIENYRHSPSWAKLSPRTRKDYERVFDWIERTMGKMDPAKMDQPTIIRMQEAQSYRMRFANYIVQVMKVLFSRAGKIGWMDTNPAKGIDMLQRAPDAPDMHQPWPREAQEAFRAAAPAGAPERTAFELAVGVSQRIGDTLALRWAQIGPDGFSIVQSKTQTALVIPPTSTLEAYLATIERRGPTIVTAENGGPLGYSGFAKRFRAARSAAAARLREDGRDDLAELMERLTVHGWRYTVAAEMAQAGASDAEIMAVTGHKTLSMIRKYGGAERQKAQAKSGQGRRK